MKVRSMYWDGWSMGMCFVWLLQSITMDVFGKDRWIAHVAKDWIQVPWYVYVFFVPALGALAWYEVKIAMEMDKKMKLQKELIGLQRETIESQQMILKSVGVACGEET